MGHVALLSAWYPETLKKYSATTTAVETAENMVYHSGEHFPFDIGN